MLLQLKCNCNHVLQLINHFLFNLNLLIKLYYTKDKSLVTTSCDIQTHGKKRHVHSFLNFLQLFANLNINYYISLESPTCVHSDPKNNSTEVLLNCPGLQRDDKHFL